MGSDSSKLQQQQQQQQSASKSATPKLKPNESVRRRTSGTPTPPTIKVGMSRSFNDGFLSDDKKSSPDRLEASRSRSGSSVSERARSGSVRHKTSQTPISIRNRQLIQTCFQNPHEVIGKKIAKRTAEKRSDFAKFYMALTQEQREELEEQIKMLLKNSVVNIGDMEEVQMLAEEFGQKYVKYRSIGFKADFFAVLADATITECAFLDNAVHPAHQTLSAFSEFVTMLFSSVRDGFYNEMRRLRRTSNSFSTGSNGSCRRKKLSSTPADLPYEGFARSASPGADSHVSDDCFGTVYEHDNGFLKPPNASGMLTARTC